MSKTPEQRSEELKALGFDGEADYQEHQRVLQASNDMAALQKAASILAGSTAFDLKLPNYIEHADAVKALDDLYASWDRFADVPVSEDGAIQAPFLHFSVGAERETIWRWFESQNPLFVVGEVLNGIRHEDWR